MPGGGQTQTKVENKDPWAPAQPYLTDIMARGGQLYNSGAGSQTWGGPLIAPMSNNSDMGINRIANIANSQMGSAGQPYNYGQNQIANNGLTSGYWQPLNTFGGISSGQNGIGTGGQFGQMAQTAAGQNAGANGILGQLAGNPSITNTGAYGQAADQAGQIGATSQGNFNNLANQSFNQNGDVGGILSGAMQNPSLSTGGQFGQVAQGAAGPTNSAQNLSGMAGSNAPTSSAQNLGGMASGADAGKNPYLTQMLEANNARIANRVNSSVAGMGRYGSAGHTDVLARTLAETDNPVLSQAYESDRNRMLSASGQIDSAQRAADAVRMGASGQIDSSRRAADATQLGALQGQTGVQQGNFSNMLGAGGQLAGMRQNDMQLGGGLLGQGVNAGFQGLNTGLAANQGLSSVQGQNAGMNLNAAGALGSSNRADTGLGIQALQGQTGVQGQNLANQMGAAQGQAGILNAGQGNAAQWASMMPGLQASAYGPANQLMGAGDYQNQYAQRNIDAQRALFEQQQSRPWDVLNRYGGALTGLGGLIGNAGTTTGNAQTQQQTPWTQYAGLGLAAAGMLSDRNEKTDIKKIGEDEGSGLPIYSYRYKDDPKTYPKVVGPMAQDIEAAFPGSTERVGGKLTIKPETTVMLGILALGKKAA